MAGKPSPLAERIMALAVGKSCVADRRPGDIVYKTLAKHFPDRRFTTERVGSQYLVRRTV